MAKRRRAFTQEFIAAALVMGHDRTVLASSVASLLMSVAMWLILWSIEARQKLESWLKGYS
jgi:hypothetical protein